MTEKKDFVSMGSLFDKMKDQTKKTSQKKPPAHEWQELALKIIDELSIPPFKRSSVFKICKNHPKVFIERCLNDTRELCDKGEKWKYFFKLISATK